MTPLRWLQALYMAGTIGLTIHAIGWENDATECMAWLLLSLDTFKHMRGPLR